VKRALHRAPLILAIPLAALTLLACSDDDDDEPTVTEADVTEPEATETDEVTLPGGITIPSLPDISLPDASAVGAEVEDFLRDGLADLGLNDDQIDCLVERIDPSSGEVPDVSELTDLFDDCDIELSDIQPGG
jgi:hypothetical protein